MHISRTPLDPEGSQQEDAIKTQEKQCASKLPKLGTRHGTNSHMDLRESAHTTDTFVFGF